MLTGFLARWWGRVRASWPAMRGRLMHEGGLRSVLILVLALGQGARADAMLDAVAPVVALGCAWLSLFMAAPTTRLGRARSFLAERMSEPGTWRSLGALVLGIGAGASAVSMVEHLEAVAVIAIGAISAAQPATPPKETT